MKKLIALALLVVAFAAFGGVAAAERGSIDPTASFSSR
jgi:hypothetical protein